MNRYGILLFVVTTIIVIYLQYDLLKPTLGIGFASDDWGFVLLYKMLGSNPLSGLRALWTERGAYTTYSIYYMGILHSLFGFNYLLYQLFNITLKILANLMIFPLVLIVFRNRFLALFTTVLFSIAYTTTGQLEVPSEGSEYLGMFLMTIFLIVYYRILKENLKSWKWLVVAVVLLVLTIMLSPIRTFPLLALILLIEAYLLFQNFSVIQLKSAVVRVFALFLPFLLVILHAPGAVLGFIGFPPGISARILEGNWHLILTPLQGLAHIFAISDYWGKIFGEVNIENFGKYLIFLLQRPTIFFGLIILILTFFGPKRRLRFFFKTFLLNLILGILIFFIATHWLYLPEDIRMPFDSPRIYSTLFGLFILVLAFSYWREWNIQGKKDRVLLALWLGPASAFLFILLTWILADIHLGFGGAQDHYLYIPTFGISLFITGLLVLVNRKLGNKLRFISIAFIFTFLLFFYLLNKSLVYRYFDWANTNGRAAADQQMIQSKFRQRLTDFDNTKPSLFYFDTSELSVEGRFWTESFLSSFPFWMHFQGNQLIDGCVELIYENREKRQLTKLIRVQDGQKGFVYKGVCVENGKGGNKQIFYKLDNFYAFRLKNKNRDFIDIKEEVLRELGF